MARIDTALAARATSRGPSHRGSLLVAVVWCAAGAILTTTSGCAAQRGAAVQTVDAVDLDRYVGNWFEIARFPNRFQDECVGGVTATYALRSDGRLDVINRCQTGNGPVDARGVARIVDTETRARLKVRFAPAMLSFLPFVWGDYWILGLAHDYSWALVGSPDREYLWILARTPVLDWEPYTLALATASSNGFAVERLIQTSQSSDVATEADGG
jgi:apolipoprotein D and lipocalin family protein